jgi:hypothetical protein
MLQGMIEEAAKSQSLLVVRIVKTNKYDSDNCEHHYSLLKLVGASW